MIRKYCLILAGGSRDRGAKTAHLLDSLTQPSSDYSSKSSGQKTEIGNTQFEIPAPNSVVRLHSRLSVLGVVVRQRRH
jgi:hypothetical protein